VKKEEIQEINQQINNSCIGRSINESFAKASHNSSFNLGGSKAQQQTFSQLVEKSTKTKQPIFLVTQHNTSAHQQDNSILTENSRDQSFTTAPHQKASENKLLQWTAEDFDEARDKPRTP